MAEQSKIEWTDATWNPIRARNTETGQVGHFCEKVSPGCKNCYASTWNARGLHPAGNGLLYVVENRPKVEFFLDEEALLKPLRWKKPRRIFVESMSDLFGDWVSDEWIDRIFAVMALCPQHTFQVLTKRAERMRLYLSGATLRRLADANPKGSLPISFDAVERHFGFSQKFTYDPPSPGWPIPNVWLGVSVEDQKAAELRIPELQSTPAALRFISAEPLLGPLDLREINLYPWLDQYRGAPRKAPEGGHWPTMFVHGLTGETSMPFGEDLTPIDWVIIGGESGAGARPCNVNWVRDLAFQCAAASVPCFVKQLGPYPYELRPVEEGYQGTDAALANFGVPHPEEQYYGWREGWTLVHTPDRKSQWVKYHKLRDKKGGDPTEWPEGLRVRQYPEVLR